MLKNLTIHLRHLCMVLQKLKQRFQRNILRVKQRSTDERPSFTHPAVPDELSEIPDGLRPVTAQVPNWQHIQMIFADQLLPHCLPSEALFGQKSFTRKDSDRTHQGVGGLLSPKSCVDVPASPRKFYFLNTNFPPNYPPISIPVLIEKHLILLKLGAFYNNLLKIHPIYVTWAPLSLLKPPIAIPNFAK